MAIDSADALAFLINATLQITIIAAATAAALSLARTATARVRHRTAVAGLLLCAIVPMVSAWPSIDAPDASVIGARIDTHALGDTAIASILVYAYGAWIVWKLTALWRAAIATRSLSHSCISIGDGPIAAAFQPFRAGHRAIELYRSSQVRTPLVCGIRRPRIIVPDALLSSDRVVVESVFAHEYAHVVRHDIAAAMAIELLTLPFSLHPAIAMLKRVAAKYRELACDDIATSDLGLQRRAYATALLRLAEFRVDGSSVGAAAAGAHLESRIQRLLAPPPSRGTTVSAGVLPCVPLLIAAAIAPWSAIAIDAGWLDLRGRWTLDVEGSELRGRVPFQSAQLQIDLAGRDVRIVHSRTRSNGRYETFELRGSADDTPFRVLLPGNATVHTRARFDDNRLITDSVGPGFRWQEHGELQVIDDRLVVRTESAFDRQRSRFELVFRRAPAN